MNLDDFKKYTTDTIPSPNNEKQLQIVCLYDKKVCNKLIHFLKTESQTFVTYKYNDKVWFILINKIQFKSSNTFNFKAYLFLNSDHIHQCIEEDVKVDIHTLYTKLPYFKQIKKGNVEITSYYQKDTLHLDSFKNCLIELSINETSFDVKSLNNFPKLKLAFIHTSDKKCKIIRFQ